MINHVYIIGENQQQKAMLFRKKYNFYGVFRVQRMAFYLMIDFCIHVCMHNHFKPHSSFQLSPFASSNDKLMKLEGNEGIIHVAEKGIPA